MLSTGARVEGIEIDRPHRVIVVDNHALQRSARVITVEDVGGTDSVRRYRRVERVEDFSVTEFDGEGLISKEYAARLNKALGGRHTSFQIRLPFVKGMLHQVDFHDFFRSAGTTHLTDLWGVKHPVAKVDVILTKSMFQGLRLADGKRQVLGGLLGGLSQVPPRPVCDQCEQRAAPGVHPAELPVPHHPCP